MSTLFSDQFRLIAWDYVDETNGVQGMLPMNDQERFALVVEAEILTQQAPDRAGHPLPWIVAVVPKGLNVANRFSLQRQNSLKRRTRHEPVVMIDRKHAFFQAYRCL